MALRCCVSLSEYNKFVYSNENLAQKERWASRQAKALGENVT